MNPQPNRIPNNEGPKICRVSWNANRWRSPTGPVCKSQNAGNHEHDYGYGYEEWLFDPNKQWEGYQYGFLQPFNASFYLYTNQIFPDIYLYTLNSCDQQRYWVAHLRDVEILTQEECLAMDAVYEQQGWKQTMRQQILEAANQHDFSDEHHGRLAHLRFKPVNVYRGGKMISIEDNHPIYKKRLSHFLLYNTTGMELPE